MDSSGTQDGQELLSIGPAARLVGVSVETLRRYERDGRIGALRTAGGERRFRRADLAALLQSFEQGSTQPSAPNGDGEAA